MKIEVWDKQAKSGTPWKWEMFSSFDTDDLKGDALTCSIRIRQRDENGRLYKTTTPLAPQCIQAIVHQSDKDKQIELLYRFVVVLNAGFSPPAKLIKSFGQWAALHSAVVSFEESA